MTDRKPWHCPSCNAYHGPHVDTCPNPRKLAFQAVNEQPSYLNGFSQAQTAAASHFHDFTVTGVQG
jgi:hypothetical protein